MINHLKPVSDELSAAGQVTPKQLRQAVDAGFKSVLNLRSPHEPNFLIQEPQEAEAVGLQYAHVPLDSSSANQEQIDHVLAVLEELPKPVLVHCGAGMRAGAIALIAEALQANLNLEQVEDKARQLGLSPEQPHLKQFILQHYSSEALSYADASY